MLSALAAIDRPEAAATLLDPMRLTIVERLAEPDSATGIAKALGLPRQRVNYHVRALEREGLLVHVGDRQRGGCVERLMQASARRYVISTAALGSLGADPRAVQDRFSSAYLMAVAARTVAEVGGLRGRADAAGKRLPTLSLDTEVRFASPEAQVGFAKELTEAVADLIARYHDEGAPEGRRFRFTVGGYPLPGAAVADAPADPPPHGAAAPTLEE